MVTTRHTRDGALEVLRDGLYKGLVGYANRSYTTGVVSQDEAVEYLVAEGYSENYATRVLTKAFNAGEVSRIDRGLYVVRGLRG